MVMFPLGERPHSSFINRRWGGVTPCDFRRPMAFPCQWLLFISFEDERLLSEPHSSPSDVTQNTKSISKTEPNTK